jgi:uncharacterized protein (DUF983 family)
MLTAMPAQRSFRTAMNTGFRCRCPKCREGNLFRGWPNRMLLLCPVCGLPYFRESGYFVGGMIFTYALTAAALLIAYFALMFVPDKHPLNDNARLAIWTAAAIILTLVLSRYGYSLWLSVDYWIEPWRPEKTS